MGWIGSVTLEIETAIAVLHDICRSVHQHGFRKIVLVNGHGGNVPLMGAVASKLSQREIFLGTTSIWDLGAEALRRLEEREGGSIGHAGEMESSIQLYLRPFLVDMARADRDAQLVSACRSRSIRVSVVRSSRLSAESTSTPACRPLSLT